MEEMVEEFLRAKMEYISAKAAYEAIRERASKMNGLLDELLEEGAMTVDEWAEKTVDIDFNLGLSAALQRLIRAEDKLIDAGRRLLETRITSEEAEKIREVWDCKFATIREKVVNVLLRWDPNI
jgi:DNA polymerase III delta prime subunit